MIKPIFEVGKIYKMKDGRDVLILANDVQGTCSLVGVILGNAGSKTFVKLWHGNGVCAGNSSFDLIRPEPEKITRWVDIYKDCLSGEYYIGDSPRGITVRTRIVARKEITFYEGEGL